MAVTLQVFASDVRPNDRVVTEAGVSAPMAVVMLTTSGTQMCCAESVDRFSFPLGTMVSIQR